MQVRHNTALLEQALEHVVKRAAIPTLQAEADALERTNKSFAIRRVATGAAVAVAAIGVGLGVYLALPTTNVRQVPAPRPPMPTPGPQPQPQPQPSPRPHPEPGRPWENVTKFTHRQVQLAATTWTVTAGHHFDGDTTKEWRTAWCYTTQDVNGVAIQIELAERKGPSHPPRAPLAGLKTLEAAKLTVPEAFELASKCSWLDRQFSVAELEPTPHATNPTVLEPLQLGLVNRVLTVTGSIGKDFAESLARYDFDVLEIRSSGGLVVEAIKAGRQLRRRGKDVQVKDFCLSACVFVLAGGQYRDAPPTSRIGVHRFRAAQSSHQDMETGQALSSTLTAYLAEMGVSIDLFHAAAAVPAESMSFLSRADMERWHLLNGRRQITFEPRVPSTDPNLAVQPTLPTGSNSPASPTQQEARGPTGWKINPGQILAANKDLIDVYNPSNDSYNTTFKSNLHSEVQSFLQISSNLSCASARDYGEKLKANRQRVDSSSENNTGSFGAYSMHGQGLRRGDKIDVSGFYDYIIIKHDQPNTIVHFGLRFPGDYTDLYREEAARIVKSLDPPSADTFKGPCPIKRLS